MEQLGLEGMPRRLYPCTPSRLNTWLDCPRRYRMTYLDRPQPPKGPPWAHNSVGAAVHNALAAYWRLPLAERTPEAAGTLLTRGWLTDGFRDAAQAQEWRERAKSMVEEYASGLDPAQEPAGVERTVATRTEVIAVSGRIDRLDHRGAALAVVDYKTGRRPLAAEDARGSLALALYAIAASRVLRRPCRTVELHHLPTGTVAAWDHTEESLGRHLRRAEQVATECAEADEAYKTRIPAQRRSSESGVEHARYDEVFPPSPGPLCGWCDYARHCPEGQAAAPRKEPWAALADAPAGR
ncbi:PD-(D/E)XK nuclease family protein [Actinocorallia sp. A-T 12471]|uniref:RecB family exonuclease n=1 Tax=Actinocorallia sp. A-T 12471 TaxID=3089813 RepID=UPI0029CAC8A2|nr:PD-(D/E)XK nuclease family protein [Actinocorallia sp. A-T 12471]MDX6738802.1 PD-(D/E)XK nuclease family protein [Actinocorallia sp. A-T 12471]